MESFTVLKSVHGREVFRTRYRIVKYGTNDLSKKINLIERCQTDSQDWAGAGYVTRLDRPLSFADLVEDWISNDKRCLHGGIRILLLHYVKLRNLFDSKLGRIKSYICPTLSPGPRLDRKICQNWVFISELERKWPAGRNGNQFSAFAPSTFPYAFLMVIHRVGYKTELCAFAGRKFWKQLKVTQQ